MGKRKPDGGKQVNFRVPDDLNARLEAVAEGLGLDVSNFLRMMLIQKLSEYEEQIEQYRKKSSTDTQED